MSELLGIIAHLRKFFSDTDENICMPYGDGNPEILKLSKNRKYIIPDFQREIRWDTDNVSQLIEDIQSGPKYLGNIILTEHSNNTFSIVDGQQRITILTLILNCICKLHGEDMDIIKPCELQIESFSYFSNILREYFPEEKKRDVEVVKSDRLHQIEKYYALWIYTLNHDSIKNKKKVGEFVENLEKSSVNIILNKSDNLNDSIRYFIDVNLKGKQLDTEDIFKSYLFRKDNGKEIREAWYKLKTNVTKLQKNMINYPLLKLLEHYFYCQLFQTARYRGLEFGEDFLLKKEFKTHEENPCEFRESTHLIEIIDSKKYMLDSMDKINRTIELMIEIVSNSSTSQKFNAFFDCINEKQVLDKMEDKELKIIHNIIGKILKDNRVLPKALIMKYIISVLLEKESKLKSVYRKIYGVYLLAVLFTIFENKKSKDVLINVLKADTDEWYNEIIKLIKNYFSSDKVTNAKLLSQIKLAANEEEENYKFRCKSLATIYNFFVISDDRVVVRKKKLQELYDYITNDNEFSVEHLIVSESRTYSTMVLIEDEKIEYKYQNKFYKRHVNNLFNFIFVPRRINSDLSNYWLPRKMEMLQKDVRCEYSKMILDSLDEIKSALEQVTKENCKDYLDLFFGRDFEEMYITYARKALTKVINRVKGEG